jgi:transcriptional regulator with XRE-family HTH domain
MIDLELAPQTRTVPVPTMGERIVMARKRAGYVTAAELADKLMVTRATVARWEADAGMPKHSTLYQISDLCNVELEWFLEGYLPTSREEEFQLCLFSAAA